MKFGSYAPGERLKPYIKQYVISENDDAVAYKVLPDTSLVMGFQYSGQLSYLEESAEKPLSSAGITGLRKTYRIFKNTPQIGSVLVMFTETGAAHFLTSPLHELFNESLSLDHFFDRQQLADTREKLALANTDEDRIFIVEQLLLRHLQEHTDDMLVLQAIAMIRSSKGNIRISDLSKALNISASPLEKRFRKVVGASPKKFASIVRSQYVLTALKHGNYQETAFINGYYDQAHLIHDFKAFTGMPPEEYMRLEQPKKK